MFAVIPRRSRRRVLVKVPASLVLFRRHHTPVVRTVRGRAGHRRSDMATTDDGQFLFSRRTADDPHPVYAQLRNECPVLRHEGPERGDVFLSRYDDIFWALRHPEYLTSAGGTLYLGEQPQIPLEVDP